MRGRLVAAVALVLHAPILGLLGCGGPLGPFPGGRLSGPEEPCPRDGFAFAHATREIQLEARPEDPWSVTTWALVDGTTLHVPADFFNPGKRWPHLVEADPRVRVRIEGRVYACEAHRVRDEATITRLRAAAAAKYDVEPDGWAARHEVWWFRVQPGPPADPPRDSTSP